MGIVILVSRCDFVLVSNCFPLQMVSHGVSMTVVALLVLVAAVAGEPGFLKGRQRCHTHYKQVPHYETVIKKVSWGRR